MRAVRIEDVVGKSVGKQTDGGEDDEDDEVFWDDEDADNDLPVEEIEAFQRGILYAADDASDEEYYVSGEAGDDWGSFADDDMEWFAR